MRLLAAPVSARAALELFSVIVCGDQVRAQEAGARHLPPRPAPPRAAAPNDASPSRIPPTDCRPPRGAGLWTVVTPTFWTEGSDFSAAGLVLPNLGDPDRPLPGEPGNRLRSAGWLTFDELERRRRHRRPSVPCAPCTGSRHEALCLGERDLVKPPVTTWAALAFDLDGTLVDTAPDIGRALDRALASAGLASVPLQSVRSWIGDGPDALIDRALAAMGADGRRRAGLRWSATVRRDIDAFTLGLGPATRRAARAGSTSPRCMRRWHGRVLRHPRCRRPARAIRRRRHQQADADLARAVLEAAGLLPFLRAVQRRRPPGTAQARPGDAAGDAPSASRSPPRGC